MYKHQRTRSESSAHSKVATVRTIWSCVFLLLLIIVMGRANATPSQPTGFCYGDTCQPEPPARGVKWHPGHYMWVDGNRTSAEVRARHFREIDAIGKEPTIRGIKLVLYWGAVEKNRDDYSAGYAIIDQYLKKLAEHDKYLILSIQDRIFGGYAPATRDEYFPRHMVAMGITAMVKGETLRVWQGPVMDRQIAMSKAMASRYDNHPNFEMYQVEETSMGVPLGRDGYTIQAYGAQLKRLASASSAAWKRTLVRVPTNFFGTDAQMLDLMSYLNTFGVAIGGPDVIPNQSIQADRLYMARYKGTMTWVSEVQSPSLGGHEGTFTAKQLYDSGMQRAPSHFIWYRNTWSGGAPQKWDTGILPYIRTIKGVTATKCPLNISCAS